MSNQSNLFEPYKLDLKKFIMGGEPLTFLVGAGISIEPPSGLESAWRIMEAILRFGSPEKAIPKILKIKNLRFEYIIQEFRDTYDPNLNLMKYFEESIQPNLIHQFLSKAARDGHYVMTTNFDALIERAVGLQEEALKVIITREEFEQFGDPEKNVKNGILAIYKLHGSLKNPKTGEDTRDSVITTLDSLGKHKEGDLFSVETFKRGFFARVCQGRSLVVMGYSGGDDFDIVPTLFQLKDLKRVIWIAHSTSPDPVVRIYRYLPQLVLFPDEIHVLSREDELLHKIRLLASVEVIKIVTHTASLIADLMEIPYQQSEPDIEFNMYNWIKRHFPSPNEEQKRSFAGKIFYNYKLYDDALNYHQQAYKIAKSLDDRQNMARSLNDMGLIYTETGKPQKALEYFQKAYKLLEKLDKSEKIGVMSNIGSIYLNTGEPQKALDYFQEAYTIYKRLDNQQGMATTIGNMGLIYIRTGERKKALEHYQQAYRIAEQLGNLIDMATSLINLGNIYGERGNSNIAQKNYQQAYEIYKRLNDPLGMAKGLGAIGLTYRSMGESDKALEYLQQAYELFERLENFSGMATTLGNIGIIYLEIKELNKAQEYYHQAFSIYKRLDNLQGMAISLGNIGLINKKTGDLKNALKHHQEAYEIHERLNNFPDMAKELQNIGLIYEEKNPKKALDYFQKAYTILEELSNKQDGKIPSGEDVRRRIMAGQHISRVKKRIEEL